MADEEKPKTSEKARRKAPKPDWRLWRQMALVSWAEAVALSLDADPEEFRYGFGPEEDPEYWERHGVALNHLEAGTLAAQGREGKLALVTFATWANGLGWSLPEEFPRPDQSRRRLDGHGQDGGRAVRTPFERLVDLIRLIRQGGKVEIGFGYEGEVPPWFKLIRETGFEDIDARLSFEKAAALVEHPVQDKPISLGPVIDSLQTEMRVSVRRISEAERVVGMAYWMYVHQEKAETKRIAATTTELAAQFGVDVDVVTGWVSRAKALGLVTYYRAPNPGKPDYYCLTEEGLRQLADPFQVLGGLREDQGKGGLGNRMNRPGGNSRVGEVAITKLRGLRTRVEQQLRDPRGSYFDPAQIIEHFERYRELANQIRVALPELFGDLPDRETPRSSGTTDFDGRGYIERHHVERLLGDIDYIVEVNRQALEPSVLTKENPTSGPGAPAATLPLLISHSSRDAELVELLAGLLRSALNLRAADIRCTSVDGYRLPGGADTNEQLRREVVGCAVLLGVISAESLGSVYVLMELGARWGTEKTFIPLLAPGMPSSALGGPLAGKNALRLDSDVQMHQLLAELGTHLGRPVESVPAYKRELDAFLRRAVAIQSAAIDARLRAELGQERAGSSTEAEVKDSDREVTLPIGLLSHYFATEPDGDTCVLSDCLVLVCAAEIASFQDLLPVLEQVAGGSQALLIVARSVTGEALPTLIKNNQMGTARASVVCSGEHPDPRKIERLVARRTRAQVFGDEAGLSLGSATVAQLGRAARVEAGPARTVITLK